MPLADKQHLVGEHIQHIRKMTSEELKMFGWHEGYIIELSNGFKITATNDDEFSRGGQFVGITRGNVKFPFWDAEDD